MEPVFSLKMPGIAELTDNLRSDLHAGDGMSHPLKRRAPTP
jgi:hypothetical protein